eukprot:TRINITY_DN4576_c0_g1_i5.p1 TRINITY_DN4576_c0_g1~~TRINITY_DN4576_c0_g1_i5.p1  ORF type:complete len:698 (-),score=170.90 TRINITY_DN4576_c0_g1_i5:135-2087(-)
MENSRQQSDDYLSYFGADATPLINFYMVQKKQELLKSCEAHARKVISQHNKAQAQTQFEASAEPFTGAVQPLTKHVRRLEDEEEFKKFEDSLVPCDLHPFKGSNNCRKCKKLRQSRIEKLHAMLKERRGRYPGVSFLSDEITITEPMQRKAILDTKPSVFQTYGDPTACNMNDLLRTNIVNSQYYREIQELTKCEEVVAQIEYFCKNAEPFMLGTNNAPSVLFCCLYKLLLIQLTEGQLCALLNSSNAYVRATGALYIRYVGKPEILWGTLNEYLLDEQVFSPSADTSYKITFGEYIEKLLTDLNYYGTRLPRLPILVEKDIRSKAALTAKKRERLQFNKENYNLFLRGAECYCLSSRDYAWHHGIVVTPGLNMKYVEANVFPEKEGEMWEETLDLGSIILASCIQSGTEETKKNESKDLAKRKLEESPRRDKHSGRSKHRSKERHSRHHRRHRSRSRSSQRRRRDKSHSRSRDRSRSRSKKRSKERRKDRNNKKEYAGIQVSTLASKQAILDQLNDESKKLIEEAFEWERDQILTTKKSEYARRPTSYKSALSLVMPVGTARKKSRSLSPQRKVVEVKLASAQRRTKTEELEERAEKLARQESTEDYERMKRIKERYGESADTKNKKSSQRKKDYEGSDVVKFGMRKCS